MKGKSVTVCAEESEARNVLVLNGFKRVIDTGTGEGTGFGDGDGIGVGGLLDTGLGFAEEEGVLEPEFVARARNDERACPTVGDEFAEEDVDVEKRMEGAAENVRVDGVGVGVDMPASAGVGMSVFRYRCKGASSAVVRAEKCWRKA